MKPTEDHKLISALNNIQDINPSAYVNVKKNIDMIYQKLLQEDAEKAFLSRQIYDYEVFSVNRLVCRDLIEYADDTLQKGSYNPKNSCYLMEHLDYNFLALFITNNNGIIVQRRFIFDKEAIDDLLGTFSNQLKRCNGLGEENSNNHCLTLSALKQSS